MLKRTSALLVLLAFLALEAKGQEQQPPFKGILKVYPLHLYRIFPTVSLAYEKRLTSKFSTTFEAGYFVNFIRKGTDYTDRRGIRLREELRYYFKYKYAQTRSNYAHGSYLSFDLHQTLVDYNDHFTRAQWREAGFGFRFGMAEYLGRINIDYSIGVSFRYANNTPPDLWASLMNFWDEQYPIIQPGLSLGIGYRIQ